MVRRDHDEDVNFGTPDRMFCDGPTAP